MKLNVPVLCRPNRAPLVMVLQKAASCDHRDHTQCRPSWEEVCLILDRRRRRREREHI